MVDWKFDRTGWSVESRGAWGPVFVLEIDVRWNLERKVSVDR